MIRTIFFDLGGVVMTINPQGGVDKFHALGLKDAHNMLNSYTQTGIFGDLEAGKITDEEFRLGLSSLLGHDVSHDECRSGWLGYRQDVPQRNLDKLLQLRQRGYRVVLTSNTNPYMMSWAESNDFDGHGHSIAHYFDALYCSYRLRAMKPSDEFFYRILKAENVLPAEVLFVDDGARNVASASEMGIRTMLATNGGDWTNEIDKFLE